MKYTVFAHSGEGCARYPHMVEGFQAGPAACHAGHDRPCDARRHDAAHICGGPDAQTRYHTRRNLVPLRCRAALRRRVCLRLHHGGLPRLGRHHHAAPHRDPCGQLEPRLGPRGDQCHGHRRQEGRHPHSQGSDRQRRRPCHLQPRDRCRWLLVPDDSDLHRPARRDPRWLDHHPGRDLHLRREQANLAGNRDNQVRADTSAEEDRPRGHPQGRRRDLPDHADVRHRRGRPQRQVQHDRRRHHRPATGVRHVRVLLGLG